MEIIDRLCCMAVESGASDIFLQVGHVPQFRIHGEMVTLEAEPLTDGEVLALWINCGAAPDALDHDTGFIASNGDRFRVNLFRSLGIKGAVLRPIKTLIPPLENLGVPKDLLVSWVQKPSGLVLVTGPTGAGKSTTLASCLDWLNQNVRRHIVTIEDPIEYLFLPNGCMFTQREVGSDTPTFAEGLRRSMRQSPDVILLGEIRDAESAVTALQAAETGHLVMATLHSSNVLDSLERLSRLFPMDERAGVMHVLSQQLVGILCQKLIPTTEGGRIVAVEHFENQAVTRKWILEEKFRDLADFLGKGNNPTTVTFLKSILHLIQTGRITETAGLQASTNPHELQRQLRGITAGSQ